MLKDYWKRTNFVRFVKNQKDHSHNGTIHIRFGGYKKKIHCKNHYFAHGKLTLVVFGVIAIGYQLRQDYDNDLNTYRRLQTRVKTQIRLEMEHFEHPCHGTKQLYYKHLDAWKILKDYDVMKDILNFEPPVVAGDETMARNGQEKGSKDVDFRSLIHQDKLDVRITSILHMCNMPITAVDEVVVSEIMKLRKTRFVRAKKLWEPSTKAEPSGVATVIDDAKNKSPATVLMSIRGSSIPSKRSSNVLDDSEFDDFDALKIALITDLLQRLAMFDITVRLNIEQKRRIYATLKKNSETGSVSTSTTAPVMGGTAIDEAKKDDSSPGLSSNSKDVGDTTDGSKNISSNCDTTPDFKEPSLDSYDKLNRKSMMIKHYFDKFPSTDKDGILLKEIDDIYDQFYNYSYMKVVPVETVSGATNVIPEDIPGLFHNEKDDYRMHLTDTDILNGYLRAKEIMIYDILLRNDRTKNNLMGQIMLKNRTFIRRTLLGYYAELGFMKWFFAVFSTHEFISSMT